jgi:hypothetical protein
MADEMLENSEATETEQLTTSGAEGEETVPEIGEDENIGAEVEGEEQETAEGQETAEEPSLEQKYNDLQANYQRLERKFTKVSQENAELKQYLEQAREAIDLYNAITQNAEIASHVGQLLDTFGVAVPEYQEETARFDPAAERQIMRELLSKPDFVKHEQEIAEWAEENGYPFESAQDQKTVYLLWKGENADRLIQEARMDAAKKAAKTQQAKQKAGLQRGGGPGKPPKPDFRKMSDDEVLAALGLSLWTDE